jgi:hypothetical protein
MRLGACGPNTKDSWLIRRIEGDQRMYDCYGRLSAADVGGFAMSTGQEVDFSSPFGCEQSIPCDRSLSRMASTPMKEFHPHLEILPTAQARLWSRTVCLARPIRVVRWNGPGPSFGASKFH